MEKARSFALAEFVSPDRLLDAASRLRLEGHPDIDTHTPYPLRGTRAALLLAPSKVPVLALVGGAAGAATAYLFQWWTSAVDYPLNVGNRPPHAYPSFVPITFELMVLFAAFAIFFGMLALWRLPRPHHPAFELEQFRSASSDGFWVSVAEERRELAEKAAHRLRELGASHISVLEEEP
ncbi:MAG: DUF3341 domain-containing protein [Myxococcales bacterium]|nr:DUF3341 domain-containing protein [Myxococcales bacterium]